MEEVEARVGIPCAFRVSSVLRDGYTEETDCKDPEGMVPDAVDRRNMGPPHIRSFLVPF